jgi:hypothetical protein
MRATLPPAMDTDGRRIAARLWLSGGSAAA